MATTGDGPNCQCSPRCERLLASLQSVVVTAALVGATFPGRRPEEPPAVSTLSTEIEKKEMASRQPA